MQKVVCDSCKKLKRCEIYKATGKPLCYSCRSKLKIGDCLECGNKDVPMKGGKCVKCYNAVDYENRKLALCVDCNRIRTVQKNRNTGELLCRSCREARKPLKERRKRRKVECWHCKEKRVIAIRVDGKPVCKTCYEEYYKEEQICYFCKKSKKRIAKITDDGRLMCAACYEKRRPKRQRKKKTS